MNNTEKEKTLNLALNPLCFNLPAFCFEHLEELKQERLKYYKNYYQENKEYFSQKVKEKRLKSKQYVIYDCTLGVFRNIIKQFKVSKIGTSLTLENYLGYSVLEFKNYFETLFHSGMTWHNHGSFWHIDHIIPNNTYKYESRQDEGFKNSFALCNLRPLEKSRNQSRSKMARNEPYI